MFCVPSGADPNIFPVSFYIQLEQQYVLFLTRCVTGFRQTASGLGSIASRVGGLVSPLVNLLGIYHPAIPTIIFSSLSIISGGLCFLLPETRRKELPESILDAESNG